VSEKTAMFELSDAEPPFRLEARRLARSICANWTEDELPLSDAYKLLSADDVENAWIADMMAWARAGELAFPIKDAESGQYQYRPFDQIVLLLHPRVIDNLRNGTFVARGFHVGSELAGKRKRIPTESWEVLTADFEHSTVTANGRLVVSGITVSRTPDAKRASRAMPQATVDKWFRNYKAYCDANGLRPSMVDQWHAAKDDFGEAVRRNQLDAARAKIAPDFKGGKGRPKKSPK
jgi:hypothetical protein